MKKIFSILISIFLSASGTYAAQMETVLASSMQSNQGPVIEKGHCRGERGPRGPRGHHGRGIRGERGHRGKQGLAGLTGPAGIFEYASATLQASSTPVQFFTNDTVPLNEAGPISSNISFDSVNHLFTVHSKGTYIIEYSLEAAFSQSHAITVPQEPVSIAININGTNDGVSHIPVGVVMPSPAFEPSSPPFRLSSTTLQLVRDLNINDTIKLVIVSANSNDQWFYGNGSTPNEVAFLSLRQIDPPNTLKASHDPFIQKGHCERGPRGPRGHRGPDDHGRRGKRGHQGEPGKQGQPGTPLVLEFGNATLFGQQEETAVTVGLVPLNTAGPTSSNISFDTSTHLFTVNTTGSYWITYYVQPCFQNLDFDNPYQPVGIAVSINGTNEGVALIPIGAALPSPTGIRTSAGTFQIMRTLNAGATVGLAIDSLDVRDSWIYGNGNTPNLVAFLSLEQV